MGAIDVSHEGRHESLLADFEKRQKARKIAVSTDDKEVKATLRLVLLHLYDLTEKSDHNSAIFVLDGGKYGRDV